MTVKVAAVRPRVLAELAERPGQTAYELAAALGYGKPQSRQAAGIVYGMWKRGELAAGTVFRQQQGRNVRIFAAAQPETSTQPRQETSGQAERRRARARTRQAQARARKTGVPATPGTDQRARALRPAAARLSQAEATKAACRTADPDLFFSPDGETQPERDRRVVQARKVCFSCSTRIQCYESAAANQERYGVWGGVDFEIKRRTAAPLTPQTTWPDAATSGQA